MTQYCDYLAAISLHLIAFLRMLRSGSQLFNPYENAETREEYADELVPVIGQNVVTDAMQ